MAHDASLARDITELAAEPVFKAFDGSTILITGSTGLIGSLYVKALIERNKTLGGSVKVLALARNEAKARSIFGNLLERDDLELILGDTTDLPEIDAPIDWISHGASMTSSKDFAAHPVEVIATELDGTRNMLELARKKHVKAMVYLSSLEVYGTIDAGHGKVCEDDQGPLDRLNPRNSYPVAKQMCECLCASYASEYALPIKIARLAQTFGAGVSYHDMRVFADFAKKIISHENIVMHTEGSGARCYCYTTDAVRALATILTMGQTAQAYNVSNPTTYCTVREMAEMLVGRYPESGSHLIFDIPKDLSGFGYAAPSKTELDSTRLSSLGWMPQIDLGEMYDRLIESLRANAIASER